MKKRLVQVDGWLFKAEMAVAVAIMVGLVLLVMMQVFNRFVLKQPLSWSEELARYLFTFLVFLGISAATKAKAHFGVTFIRDQFPHKIQLVMDTLAFMGIAVFLGVVFYKSFAIINNSMLQTSSAMGITIGYIYYILPVFSFCALFHVITNYIVEITGGEQ